jgi:ferredoxin
MSTIAVDLSCCEGHGKCYLVAPDLMRPMDDVGHAEFYADPIDPSDTETLARAQAAIKSCPEQALSLEGSSL